MRILYLHGFNSAGYGPKVDALRAAFGGGSVLNPTLPPQPADALALLNDLIPRLKGPDFWLLGSSLGGFYALHLALHHEVPAILVNPAIQGVADGLSDQLGPQCNYKTGENYIWKPADLDALRPLELKEHEWPLLATRVRAYLDAGDERLPTPRIAEFLQTHGLPVKLYPGGDHSFQHFPELLADWQQAL